MNITLRIANYISRYAPSRRKIITYLEKKKIPEPIRILEENGYDESMMCDMWMRSFVALGKGKRDIQLKLSKKEFPKEMILEKLENFDAEIHDWESNRLHIENQIRTLEGRGKSRRMIFSTLVSRYSYFRDEITELLSGTDDTDNLAKEVQKYKNKYNLLDPKEKQKFYAALMRKGFSYSDIKSHL